MIHRKKLNFPLGFRSLGHGVESELFVVGVLTILLIMVCIRAFLPPMVLPAIGLAAFAALLLGGAALLSARNRTRSEVRWRGIPVWGIIAVFAIVWIAAGRLAGMDHLERWLLAPSHL